MSINVDDLTIVQIDEIKKQIEIVEARLKQEQLTQCVQEVMDIIKQHNVSVESVIKVLASNIGVNINTRSSVTTPRFKKGLKFKNPETGDIYTTGTQGKPPAWFSTARQDGTLEKYLVDN